MFETILLIAVLVAAAMALTAVEICTPTFGLLAATAIGCVAWAVYLCFSLDGTAGLVALIVVLVGGPVYAVWAVRIIPDTALGRRLALRRDVARAGQGTPEADELASLVGRKTDADSVLRPSGVIRVDGRRVVAQAESGMIGRGEMVEIIRACGNYVVVRKAEES